MNWKLIFSLSLFGLAMAIATVFWIPAKVEPVFWLVIFIICAYVVAKNAPGKYFLHGFCISLINCIWITGAHIAWQTTYLANHADEAAYYAKMSHGMSVTQSMLIMGPAIGIISGLILGLFCFIASKIVKKNKVRAAL